MTQPDDSRSIASAAPAPDSEPRGVPGKWVILAIFAVSILASTLAVLHVRPIPGSKPAEVHNRPFGPATPAEKNDAPLVYRRSDGD